VDGNSEMIEFFLFHILLYVFILYKYYPFFLKKRIKYYGEDINKNKNKNKNIHCTKPKNQKIYSIRIKIPNLSE